MTKFCKECGGEVPDSSRFCKHCGHELETDSENVGNEEQSTYSQHNSESEESFEIDHDKKTEANAVNAKNDNASSNQIDSTEKKSAVKKENPIKNSLSKKQKIILASVGVLVAAFVGFYLWGNSYYSSDKVAERFANAITEEDSSAIQSLAVVDGEELSDEEAAAFLELATDDTYIRVDTENLDHFVSSNELFEIEENEERALGLFNQHYVDLVPQYIEIRYPFEGIETTFDGIDVAVDSEEEGYTVYGPLAPGKYITINTYSGEYTEANAEEEVILSEESGSSVAVDVNIDVDYVDLSIYNEVGIPIENAYVTIGGQQVAFDESLYIEELGPLNLDGSITVEGMVETAFGEVEIEPMTLTSNYHEFTVNTLTDNIVEEITDVLTVFADEYVQVYAQKDASLFTTVTEEYKDFIQDDIDFMFDDQFYKGELEDVEISTINMSYIEEFDGTWYLTLPTVFYLSEVFYFEEDADEAELEEIIEENEFAFVYDEENQEWLIDDMLYFLDFVEDSELESIGVSTDIYEHDSLSKDSDE